SLGRLTDEAFDHYDNTLDQAEHYGYDLVGNRRELDLDKGNNGSVNEVFLYTYDANDRLLTERDDLDNNGSTDVITTFGYTGTQQTSKSVKDNATGVVTESTTFQFNLQGQLSRVLIDRFNSTGVKTQHGQVHYAYGPDGIRVSALDEQDTNADGAF